MEKVKVLAQFDGTKVKPLAFRRGAHLYQNLKLNMVYHFREGEQNIWRFSVSDSANSYQLRFETDLLQWYIEEET